MGYFIPLHGDLGAFYLNLDKVLSIAYVMDTAGHGTMRVMHEGGVYNEWPGVSSEQYDALADVLRTFSLVSNRR